MTALRKASAVCEECYVAEETGATPPHIDGRCWTAADLLAYPALRNPPPRLRTYAGFNDHGEGTNGRPGHASGGIVTSPNLDDDVTAATIARWMLGKLERDGRLYQRAVVLEIADRFDSEFVFLSDSGHLAIDGRVKRSFKRLTPEVMWEADARCWRWRRPGDAPGRNQGTFVTERSQTRRDHHERHHPDHDCRQPCRRS